MGFIPLPNPQGESLNNVYGVRGNTLTQNISLKKNIVKD